MRGRVSATVLFVVVAIAGVAVAAGTNPNGLTVCAAKKSGAVRLAKGGRCGRRAVKLVVAQQGRRGPTGLQGPMGGPGRDGTPVNLEVEAVRPVAPYAGGCGATPGTFCGDPSGDIHWHSLRNEEPLGYRKDPGGWVRLSGSAIAEAEGGTQVDDPSTIFYLPPGYRPTDGIHRFYLPFSGCNSPFLTLLYVDVLPNGAVRPQQSAGCWLGFESVAFRP